MSAPDPEAHLSSVLFLLGHSAKGDTPLVKPQLRRPSSAAWPPPARNNVLKRPVSAALLRQQTQPSPSLLLFEHSKVASPRSGNFMAGRSPMLLARPRSAYRPSTVPVKSGLRSPMEAMPPRHQIGRQLSGGGGGSGRPASARVY